MFLKSRYVMHLLKVQSSKCFLIHQSSLNQHKMNFENFPNVLWIIQQNDATWLFYVYNVGSLDSVTELYGFIHESHCQAGRIF